MKSFLAAVIAGGVFLSSAFAAHAGKVPADEGSAEAERYRSAMLIRMFNSVCEVTFSDVHTGDTLTSQQHDSLLHCLWIRDQDKAVGKGKAPVDQSQWSFRTQLRDTSPDRLLIAGWLNPDLIASAP